MGGEKKPNRFESHVPAKAPMTEINQYLMCQLCSGYLVDATAIIECQHTFCKSCILKYLDTNSYCPICDVQLNKAKPHLSLRADTTLQKLVYKMVPGLLVTEVRRRKEYQVKVPSSEATAAATPSTPAADSVELEEAEDVCVLSMDDAVSLSLEYYKGSGGTGEDALASVKKCSSGDKANDRRYLQCPAAVSVGLLKKFIRMKYGLSDDYRVDLLYNGDRDKDLENDLTLLDLAVMFKWKKTEPMCFYYRIFDRPVKSELVRVGSKRTASSMMDEPPDDDGASGTANNSMASPSKLSRLSEGNQGGSTSGSSSGNSGSGGRKKSHHTSQVVPMETSTSTSSSTNNKKTRSRSQSIASDSKDKEDVEDREPSPPQTRSSLTLKLSKRLTKGLRSRSNSSTSNVKIPSHRLLSPEGSVREAVEKIVLSKKVVERKTSDPLTSPSSCSSGSDMRDSPPSLKISLKNATMYHHHHHKHKHKSKDRERHKHHKSSSSPKHHHHRRAKRGSKESSEEEVDDKEKSEDDKVSNNSATSKSSSQTVVSSNKNADEAKSPAPIQRKSSTEKEPEKSSNHHPLVPESVQMQVPKSVTLIPVNPNAPTVKRSSTLEKNPPVNRNTFTHPITNKSLHQITVTEVPPPPKSTGPSTPTTSAVTTSTSATNSSSNKSSFESGGGSSGIPAPKPHFSAPDSMEITKIYCDNSGKAFDPSKKLKERKGLDITISPSPGPQINNNNNTNNSSNNKGRKLSDDSLTFSTKFTPKGIKPLNSQAPKGFNNLKTTQLPFRANVQAGASGKPEPVKNKRPSISIEPALTPGLMDKNNMSSSHRKAISNLDSSIAIYEVGSLHRTPSPPKEKGLVVTPIPNNNNNNNNNSKEAMMPPKNIKRFEPPKQQKPPQVRQESKTTTVAAAVEKKREKEHDSPLDLSGKSSRSPTDNKSERFPSPKPPTPVASPTASPSPDRQKAKQQASAAQTQTILSIAQSLAQKQQMQLQQQQKEKQLQKEKLQREKQQQHQQHRDKQQQQQQQREKQHQQQHQREKQQHQQQQQKQRSSPLPPNPPKSQSHSPSSSAVAAAAAAAAAIGSLTHPLSSSMIPMSQPSPPGSFHPLRNLVTLSEAASLMKLKNHEQQSLNSINQLVAAAAVGSSMSPPATQMLPSPRSSLLPPSMTMRPSHLPATLGSPSSGTLSLPPKSNMLHDGLGGMPWAASMNLQRGLLQQGLGAGSLSPPMPNPLSNPYLSGLSHPPVSVASQAMRPSPTMRIPSSSKKDTVPSKNNSAPLSSASQWPPMGIYNNSKPSLPDNNKSLLANPHTSASHILRSSSLSSSASAGSSRQSKMNGTLGSSQDHSPATFVAPSSIKPVSKTPVSSKNAIPNSMKISNFLPPPQSKSNGSSNAPATITSSSSLAKYFSSMPPLLPPQSPPSGSGGSDGKIKTSSCPPQPSPLSSLSSLPSSFAFPLSSSHLSSAAPPSLPTFKFNRSSSPPGSSARTMPVSVATAAAAATTAETFALSINCDTGRSKECSKSPTKSSRASQPQNQAVRHIPNPSLLFNRQANNSSCQTQNNASNNLPKNKETKEDSVNMPESTKKSVSDEAKTAPVATATANSVAVTTATAKDAAVTTVSAKEAKATVTAEDVAATALAKGVTVNAKEVALKAKEVAVKAEDAALKAEEATVKAEEAAVKAEEAAVRLPIEEVIPLIIEATTPIEETKAPIKEVTMSTDEVTTPIEDAAAPTEVIAAPIEQETVTIKRIVACIERIQPPPQTAVIAKNEKQNEELAPTVERPQANDTEKSTQQIETAESVEIPVTEEHDKKPPVPTVEPEVKPAVESEQIEEPVEKEDLVDGKALKVETEVAETVESMAGVEPPEPEKVAEESTQEPEKATCEEMNLMENAIEASAEVQKPEMTTCEKMDLQENTVEATVDVLEPAKATDEEMDLHENTVEATVEVQEPTKATYEEMVEEKMTEVQEPEKDANATSTSATLEAEKENTKGTEVQEPETATAVTTEDQEPEKLPLATPEETAVHKELVECEKPLEESEAEMPEKVTETVEALNTTEPVQDSLTIVEPAVLTTDANAQLPTIPQETVGKNADENIEKEALTEINEEPTTPAPVEEPAKEPEAIEKELMTSVEKVAEDSQIAAPSESVQDGIVNCEPMEIFASEPSVEPGRDSIEAPEGTQTSDFDTATEEITAEESVGTIIQDEPAEEMESEILPEETATQGTEDLTVQKDSTGECENVEDTPVSPKNVEEVSGDKLIEEEAEVMEVENAEIIQAEDATSEEGNMAVEDESQEVEEAAENPADEITIADTTTVIEMEKIADLPQAQQSITELDNEISGMDIHCPSPNEPQIIATLTTPLIDSPPEEQSNQVECPHDDSVNVNEEVAIEDKLKGIKDTAAVDSDEVKDFDENSDELIIDTKRSVENDEIETATEPAESSVENYGEDNKKQIELSIQSDSQEDETTEEEDDVATTEESQEAIAGEESFTVPVQEEQISHPVEEEEEEEAMEVDHVSGSLESSSSAPQNGEETAEAALAIEAVEAIQIKVDPEINSLHNADATTVSEENNEDESSQVDTVPCIIKREVIEEHMEMDALAESEPEHTPEVPMDIENTPDINEGQFEQPVEDGELDEMNTACSTEEDEAGNSSSSRPDSPIKVELKKMENLEKVTAGLLATAANSINNNNNNSFTSGVGVPCDLGVGTATTTV